MGVGLGLCLAHQVISYHKGRINIESKLGFGTDVVVRLPFSERERVKKNKNFQMAGAKK